MRAEGGFAFRYREWREMTKSQTVNAPVKLI